MSGFGAYLRSLREKMVRDPLPPRSVAGGWALGMFIGCSIPFGFQLIVSVPLAFALRLSKIGATVGTLVTNPVTIFFIYPAQTMMMNWLLRRDLDWEHVKEAMASVARNGDWHTLFALSGDLVLCFLLGGLLLAAVLTPITYFAVYRIVARHRRRSGAVSESTNS